MANRPKNTFEAGQDIKASEVNENIVEIWDILNGCDTFKEAFFGDGSDGDVTISSDTTLTRDMFYNNLTINSGVKLTTNGFRLFIKGTLTNNGIISAVGNNGGNGTNGGSVTSDGKGANGAGGAGGAGLPSGSIFGSKAGQAGCAGQDGSIDGSDQYYTKPAGETNSFVSMTGAKGGNGGRGSGNSTTWLTQTPTATTVSAWIKQPYLALTLFNATGLLKTAGESGGGGGGTRGASNWLPIASGGGGGGGGAGGNGGIILIIANKFISNGEITVKGGNGGNGGIGGSASGGSAGRNLPGGGGGGGAGGNGGVVILILKKYEAGAPSFVLTGGTGGSGGIGGNGGGGSLDGANGANGTEGIGYIFLV